MQESMVQLNAESQHSNMDTKSVKHQVSDTIRDEQKKVIVVKIKYLTKYINLSQELELVANTHWGFNLKQSEG